MALNLNTINLNNFNPVDIIKNPLVSFVGLILLIIVIVGVIGFLIWLFIYRPRLFNIEIEKHLVEGTRPIEATALGRLWVGKDGVNRLLVFNGVFYKSKRLPEPPFNYFITKLLGNNKSARKIRYLVSSTDEWTPLPPPEFDEKALKERINVPKANLSLWNQQEKKSVQRALLKESWWEQNKNFVQYLIAWAFTLIIVYLVVKELGVTLSQAQQAQAICQSVQTQCEVQGAQLAGVI